MLISTSISLFYPLRFFFFLSVLVWLQAGKGKDGRVCGYQVVQLEADQKPNNTFSSIIFL